MRISRRDFLKAAAAAVVAGKLAPAALARLQEVLRAPGGPRVIWLQGAGCDGCAISFLNSVHYDTVDNLLLNTLDVQFQSNLMAAAGDLAISAAQAAGTEPGYILVIEGAIPVGAAGNYCRLWPGMTMADAVTQFAANAGFILALGACACYGGVSGGAPNPTQAKGVGEFLGGDSRLVNVPGCPAHPDWFIGTGTYILTAGHLPPLDAHRRPLQYFGERIHANCYKRHQNCGEPNFAEQLGEEGCLEYLGCKGKHTYSDCPIRKWNSRGKNEYGVNWCIGSGSPCLGCVNPTFPDGMSPFYVYLPAPREAVEEGAERPPAKGKLEVRSVHNPG
jgi:NiFe hydrogenase small subunit HydA